MKKSRYDSHEQSVGLLFWQTSISWERKIKSVLRKYDLTHTQFVILAVITELQEKEKEVNQKMISEISMIDVMTVSATIRLMMKKGYVKRVDSVCDSRAKCISISADAQRILEKALVDVEQVDKEFFSYSTEDLAKFMGYLKQLK